MISEGLFLHSLNYKHIVFVNGITVRDLNLLRLFAPQTQQTSRLDVRF